MVWVPADGARDMARFAARLEAAGGKVELEVRQGIGPAWPYRSGMPVITMEGFLAWPSDEPSFSSSDP
jgi:hypothetical protein